MFRRGDARTFIHLMIIVLGTYDTFNYLKKFSNYREGIFCMSDPVVRIITVLGPQFAKNVNSNASKCNIKRIRNEK